MTHYNGEHQGETLHYYKVDEEHFDEARKLLHEFVNCGKPPYNPQTAYMKAKKLSELGYAIIYFPDDPPQYGICPKKIVLSVLKEER